MTTRVVIAYTVSIDTVKHSVWTVKHDATEGAPRRYWVESDIGYQGGSHDNYLAAMHEAKELVDVIRTTQDVPKAVHVEAA